MDRGDDDEEEDNYQPTKRYTYSREYKLATIDYYQTTWKEKLDKTYERLLVRYASKKLKISRKQLRNWVANKEKIQNQKRGSFRACKSHTFVQEPKLEQILNNRFKKARDQGRKISYKWILCYAKKIYEELYPTCIVVHEFGKRLYL